MLSTRLPLAAERSPKKQPHDHHSKKSMSISNMITAGPLTAGDLLRTFIGELDSHGISYCVMNNYQTMPEEIPSDVDIAIESRWFKRLDPLLINFAKKNDVVITQKIWHGYRKCAYILSPLFLEEAFRLQLDFFADFSTKKYPNLISNENLLRNRRLYKNFFVPSPEIEAPFILMRRIVKNDLKTSHLLILKVLLEASSAARTIKEFMGEKASRSLISMIEKGDASSFQSNLKDYREALKKLSRKNISVVYRAQYMISQFKRLMERLLHPVGISIVFLGPDGSGKSTIANLVMNRVAGSFHGSSIKYWRPRLFPTMGSLKVWNPSIEQKENPAPHNVPTQGRMKSLIRFFYYMADYILGYPLKVYLPKVRKQIVVFDRYYYDYLVDLRRYQFNVPIWLPGLLLPLIPRPDLAIYLDAEPTDLMKRKQELTLEEMERQVKTFRSKLSIIPNSAKIMTDRSVEAIVKEISYLVLKKKVEQTKTLLRNEHF
jgi:thymidylate kinase